MKASIVKRMMPPNNESVRVLSNDIGVSEPSLYKWRKKAKTIREMQHLEMDKLSDRWSSEDKFLVVMETYAMNASRSMQNIVVKKVFIKNRLTHGEILV